MAYFSCFLGKIEGKVYEINAYENNMKTTQLEKALAELIKFSTGQERSSTGYSGAVGLGRAGYPRESEFIPVRKTCGNSQPRSVTGYSGAVGLGRAGYPRESDFIEVRGENYGVIENKQ